MRLGDRQASESSSLLGGSEPGHGEVAECKAEAGGKPKYRRTRAKDNINTSRSKGKAAAALEPAGPYDQREGLRPSQSSSQSLYEGPTSRDLSRG